MTETIHFRKGTRADRDAILELRKLAFPDDDLEKQQPDFWGWEFVNGYAGPAHFFVAEARDRIVGHFAFVPQVYEPHAIRGALACDVMTHPNFRRQKVFSRLSRFAADHLKKDFQLITAFQIREIVMGGMLAGGWRPVLQVPILLKPLSLLQIVRDSFGRLPEPPPLHSSDSVRPVDFDQIDALLATSNIRQPRTRQFLEWRYTRNPHWRYEVEGFFERDKLRAFLIHREATLRGRRTLSIADAGGGDEALRKLVRSACRRHGTLGLAAAFISREHPAYRALRRSGFIPGPHRFRLLLQVFDEKLRSVESAPWSLTWGDTDHL